jgi:integrase
MASVHQRGDRWVVRWRDAGGRGARAHAITVSSERNALRLKVEIEDAIDRHGRYEPRRAGSATALEVIAVDYVQHLARRCAPSTVENVARQLELFRRWAGAGALADDVLSFARLSDYHATLGDPEQGRHQHARGPETVRKYVEAVERLWAWAWQRQARGDYHGVPQPDSLDLVRAPAPRREAPTWAQMDAAIGVSSGWHERLFIVLRCTGLRVQQALGLRWDDVEDRAGVWWLRVRPELGKSRQERRGRLVPLAPVLVEHLAGWGRRDGWLLDCPREDRQARARDADRAWTRAGVPAAVWQGRGHHAFRAGFQSELRRLGVDVDVIEHLVGHSRGDVHERYVGPGGLPLVEAVSKVPVLDLEAVRTRCEQRGKRLRVIAGGTS